MADYSTASSDSPIGWIIGTILVVLVLLYVMFGRGLGVVPTDAPVGSAPPAAVLETAPAAVAPAPASGN